MKLFPIIYTVWLFTLAMAEENPYCYPGLLHSSQKQDFARLVPA